MIFLSVKLVIEIICSHFTFSFMIFSGKFFIVCGRFTCHTESNDFLKSAILSLIFVLHLENLREVINYMGLVFLEVKFIANEIVHIINFILKTYLFCI